MSFLVVIKQETSPFDVEKAKQKPAPQTEENPPDHQSSCSIMSIKLDSFLFTFLFWLNFQTPKINSNAKVWTQFVLWFVFEYINLSRRTHLRWRAAGKRQRVTIGYWSWVPLSQLSPLNYSILLKRFQQQRHFPAERRDTDDAGVTIAGRYKELFSSLKKKKKKLKPKAKKKTKKTCEMTLMDDKETNANRFWPFFFSFSKMFLVWRHSFLSDFAYAGCVTHRETSAGGGLPAGVYWHVANHYTHTKKRNVTHFLPHLNVIASIFSCTLNAVIAHRYTNYVANLGTPSFWTRSIIKPFFLPYMIYTFFYICIFQ